MTPRLEWHDADEVMGLLRGAQIVSGSIDPEGLYLTFSDMRVLVIVGLPALGVALVQSEQTLQ